MPVAVILPEHADTAEPPHLLPLPALLLGLPALVLALYSANAVRPSTDGHLVAPATSAGSPR